jgi:hypothetical protein
MARRPGGGPLDHATRLFGCRNLTQACRPDIPHEVREPQCRGVPGTGMADARNAPGARHKLPLYLLRGDPGAPGGQDLVDVALGAYVFEARLAVAPVGVLL